MMKFVVYVLLCLADNTRYIGQTNNLNKRIKQHLKGQVSYTKTRFPLKLLYTEIVESRQKALEREKYQNQEVAGAT